MKENWKKWKQYLLVSISNPLPSINNTSISFPQTWVLSRESTTRCQQYHLNIRIHYDCKITICHLKPFISELWACLWIFTKFHLNFRHADVDDFLFLRIWKLKHHRVCWNNSRKTSTLQSILLQTIRHMGLEKVKISCFVYFYDITGAQTLTSLTTWRVFSGYSPSFLLRFKGVNAAIPN